MSGKKKLPQIGDLAPAFVADTQKGTLHFPADLKGKWCVFFCHPANFSTGWRMYSDYLLQKERWLEERNTQLLMLCNPAVCGDLQGDIVSRYLSLCLGAPIIIDADNRIADLYGMSPTRYIAPPAHRLLYIIDPKSIIQHIIHRPLVSIQQSLADIANTLEALQGKAVISTTSEAPKHLSETQEGIDEGLRRQKIRPAYWNKSKHSPN